MQADLRKVMRGDAHRILPTEGDKADRWTNSWLVGAFPHSYNRLSMHILENGNL